MCALSTLSHSINSLLEPIPMCYQIKCDKNNELSVYVSKQKKISHFEGEKLSFFGYIRKLTCPNPEIACNMKKYLSILHQDPINESWSIYEMDFYNNFNYFIKFNYIIWFMLLLLYMLSIK